MNAQELLDMKPDDAFQALYAMPTAERDSLFEQLPDKQYVKLAMKYEAAVQEANKPMNSWVLGTPEGQFAMAARLLLTEKFFAHKFATCLFDAMHGIPPEESHNHLLRETLSGDFLDAQKNKPQNVGQECEDAATLVTLMVETCQSLNIAPNVNHLHLTRLMAPALLREARMEACDQTKDVSARTTLFGLFRHADPAVTTETNPFANASDAKEFAKCLALYVRLQSKKRRGYKPNPCPTVPEHLRIGLFPTGRITTFSCDWK